MKTLFKINVESVITCERNDLTRDR